MLDQTPHLDTTAPPTQRQAHNARRLLFLGLSLGALGVVYGDIGTSPLYAIRECFINTPGASGKPPMEAVAVNVLGVLSLVFWSLTLVVAVKYMIFVMRADNRGEGGILALLSLLIPSSDSARTSKRKYIVTLVGLFGAALLLADGMITPSISVLSAVEGLRVAAPHLTQNYVIVITVAILLALFIVQRFGTAAIGFCFGPVMIIWFTTIAALGIPWIIKHPDVLRAINPYHGWVFIAESPSRAFHLLGYVVLAITGAEALYADMGHFGRGPIRTAWYFVVFPALLLNYFGQGAWFLAQGSRVSADANPFFALAPRWFLYPTVVIATVATVIASQALISGAFSLTKQAIQLGYCPRMRIVHTSSRVHGQIFIPTVSWLLMLSCIFLVLVFQTSSKLAAAYGIAVMGTMMITTGLLLAVAYVRWEWAPWKVALLGVVFVSIDAPFLVSNLTKFEEGGWFPIVMGVGLFIVMTTWNRGREIVSAPAMGESFSLQYFLGDVVRQKPHRIRGTAVFMTSQPMAVPSVLLHHFKHNQVLHERIILLHIFTRLVPHVAPEDRITLTDLGNGFFQIVATYGYMEEPRVQEILRLCKPLGIEVDPQNVSYYLGRVTLLTTGRSRLVRWRKHLFAFLYHNETDASAFYNLPPNRVVELGRQVEL